MMETKRADLFCMWGINWIQALGITVSLLAYGIDWAYRSETVSEAIVFGTLGFFFFVPYGIVLTVAVKKKHFKLLQVANILGGLASLLASAAFLFWLHWSVAGRGIESPKDGSRVQVRDQVCTNLAITVTVLYFTYVISCGALITATYILSKQFKPEKPEQNQQEEDAKGEEKVEEEEEEEEGEEEEESQRAAMLDI